MAKKLELKFANEAGSVVTISLDNPIEPVDPLAVSAAMDEIITQNAFSSSGGNLTGKSGARIVERTINDITIA